MGTRPTRDSADGQAWDAAMRLIRDLPLTPPELDGPLVRQRLRRLFSKNPAIQGERDIEGLFLFGSAGRGEPAADLDFLCVTRELGAGHIYERVVLDGIECDLNVVSQRWLATSWRDPEWGYWANEAFPLFARDAHVIETWQQAANRYWSRSAIVARRDAFRHMSALLADRALRTAHATPLLARLLCHEAIRVSLIRLIDQNGLRPFSHRTFLLEATRASRLANVDLECVMRGLLNETPHLDSSSAYVALRRWISAFLRSSLCSRLGFDRSASMADRVSSLASFSNVALDVEEELSRRAADAMLPPLDRAVLASVQASGFDISAHEIRSKLSVLSVPEQGSQNGIRWVDVDAHSLKVIIGTGGCRTPSCRFCALPAYGRHAAHVDMSAVHKLIQEKCPSSVSIYNDGSLLNPDEFDAAQWSELCEALRTARTRHLQVESIPRFVFGRELARIRTSANLDTISVGMGLQTIGNSFAVEELGRPDVDAVFDRAIAEAHDVGVHVRIYLLWGFGRWSQSEWALRLAESLDWAMNRRIERITICPYVETGPSVIALENSICALRATLSMLRAPPDGRIDVSVPNRPSCGIRYAGHECRSCRDDLRTRSWHGRGACQHQGVALGTN
jgi:hypothetical protein